MTDNTTNSGPGLHRILFDEDKTNIQIYTEMVLGSSGGLIKLVKFELVMLLCNGIPGALGIVLRKKLYRQFFKSIGKNVIFGRNMTIRHPHKISIENNAVFDDNTVIDAKGPSNQGIQIGNNFTMGRNSALVCKNGDITIGDNVNITTNVNLMVSENGKIKVGNNIDIGAFTHFSANSYNFESTEILPSAQEGKVSKGIEIEDLVWIASHVCILDGVTLKKGSIIGAGSVVTKDVPEYYIAMGIPAKPIRSRKPDVVAETN